MSDESDETDPLELYWDDLRVAGARRNPDPSPPDFSDQVGPQDLVIGTAKKRILVIVKPDGTLLYGPEYSPDEAAVTFWEAMGRRRLGAEERIVTIQHMDRLFIRLGAADIRCETLRMRANAETNPVRRHELDQAAEQAMRQLESIANEAIEFGRGLASRPEIAVPAAPQNDPEEFS